MAFQIRRLKYILGGYGIHEVYFTNNKPTSWTEEPIALVGNSNKDLKGYYKMCKKAFKSPTLLESDLIKNSKK